MEQLDQSQGGQAVSDIVDVHVAYIRTISDLNQDKAELLKRIKRLEEALDTLTCVIGLTPIKGNLAALQEAFDMARAVLKAKEAK